MRQTRMDRLNTKVGWAWAAGVVAVASLALSGYALFSGDDEDTGKESKSGESSKTPSSSAPTYSAPDEWTEPNKWAALPRGKHTDSQDNEVGFPHTTEGAVAMLAAAHASSAEGSRDTVDEQMGVYDSYMSKQDQTAENEKKIKAQARETDKKLRRQMGAESGRLPSGAYVRNNVIGFKVIEKSGGEVSVWLLSRVAMKGGETAKEKVSYTTTLAAGVWEGGDWKLSSAATSAAVPQAGARPETVKPGDKTFNTAGWTAIREAS